MWGSVSEVVKEAQGWYRRNVWDTPPAYLEVWLEKDALSGTFQDLSEGPWHDPEQGARL
jgi:hypothetical protein